MSITHQQIIQACLPILRSIEIHTTETQQQRRLITAYQIWFELRQQSNPICNDLIRECGGEYVGKNTGSCVGQAQKIAQALGNSPEIETQYLDTRYINFNGTKPAGPDCGLFRIRT